MNLQAIFFDFDGVLADSVEVKTKAFAKLYQDAGPAVQERVVAHHRAHGGMSRFDKFRTYAREFLGRELSQAEMDQLCARFAAIVVDEVVAAPEIAGAGRFLEHTAGIMRFVVSGTPQDEMRAICRRRGMAGHFLEILGSPTGKAEHVARLLEAYRLDPARCLFIGDAGSDLAAAKANHVPFLAVLPGEHAPLLALAPDVTWFRDVNALWAYLKAQAKDTA